jgi:class 3 adenylate cyclase
MTRCFNCGSDNPDGLKFCNQCGVALNARCSQCGFNNAPGARFCGECGASLTGAPVRPAVGQPFQAVDRLESRSHSRPSERRHLTVLFCDLVGSTEIAARLDPEEWQETVAAYHRAAAEAISRFGGYVAKYLGDGVMAYFGYPEAHDNDAERAARAGLAILEAIARLNQTSPLPDMRTSQTRLLGSTGAPPSEPSHMPNNRGGNTRQKLSARVGIDSGAVVVGTGAGTETDVFGEAPNIAARVQAAAAPDTVLISAATYRLVAGLFVVEDCGAQALKGIEQPMQLHRVIQPAGVRGRLAAAAASRGLTPFVGREDELRMLTSRWQRVLDGEGQVVLIIGEAGIGKSRLLQQFHQQIVEIPHTWVETAAAPFYQNTPFYPVAEVLWQLVWEQSLNRFADYLRELQSEGEEYGANAQSASPPSPSPISRNEGEDRDAPHRAAGSPSPLSDMGEGALGEAERSRAKESATCAYRKGGGVAAVSGESPVVYDAANNLVRGAADSVTLEDCGTLPMPGGMLTIEFLTQTRLKHEGRFIRHPDFQVVFRRLLGRLSSLARFHCGAPLDVDFRGLIDESASIRLMQDDTRWTQWRRYSSRQDRRMEWEGIIGSAIYEGDFTPFWKFLKFGELVHVGHSATFGLGKYRILNADLANNQA